MLCPFVSPSPSPILSQHDSSKFASFLKLKYVEYVADIAPRQDMHNGCEPGSNILRVSRQYIVPKLLVYIHVHVYSIVPRTAVDCFMRANNTNPDQTDLRSCCLQYRLPNNIRRRIES